MMVKEVVFLLLLIRAGDGLIGYDCAHPNTEGVTISTFGTSECFDYASETNQTLKYIQVLSIKKHASLEYYHCSIFRSSLIYKCGGIDHIMLLPSSLVIEEAIDTTADDCDRMINTGRYVTPSGGIIEGITLGTPTTFQAVDAGSSDTNGKCEGTTLVYNGVTYTKAVKVSQYKIMVSTGSARKLIASHEVMFNDGQRCQYNRGSCYTPMTGRRIWKVIEALKPCGTTQYDLLYEGWANETISSTAPLVITDETPGKNFALATKYKAILCGYQGHITDDDSVIIITGRPGELPKHNSEVDTYDYNPFYDTNLNSYFWKEI